MFCYFCGKENSEKQNFCKYCGKKLHLDMKLAEEPVDDTQRMNEQEVKSHKTSYKTVVGEVSEEELHGEEVAVEEDVHKEEKPVSEVYEKDTDKKDIAVHTAVTEEPITAEISSQTTVEEEPFSGVTSEQGATEENPAVQDLQKSKSSGVSKLLIAVISMLSVVLVLLVAFLVIYLKGGIPGLEKDYDTASMEVISAGNEEIIDVEEAAVQDETIKEEKEIKEVMEPVDENETISETQDQPEEQDDMPDGGDITDSDWQEEYKKIIDESLAESGGLNDWAYSCNFPDKTYYVYDIDKDDIPELIAQYGLDEASLHILIYSIDRKTKKAVQLGETETGHSSLNTYPEGNGIVRDMCHMNSQDVDRIYIENGKIHEDAIVKGVHYNLIDEFYKDIDEIVPGSLYMEPTWMTDDSAITGYRDHIKEKASMKNKDIHRYDIFTEDITWTEAWERCRQKGGYLARIDTKEENDHICNLMNSKGLTGIAYIGGRRETEGSYTMGYHWVGNDGELYDYDINHYEYEGFWLEGEPSLFDEVNGQKIDENYMCLIYIKSQGKWLWNDINNDVLSLSPKYYKGKISYVCEFE